MFTFNKNKFLVAILFAYTCCWAQRGPEVYNAGKYVVYRDSIVQGVHVAKVLSDQMIVSNYKSPANTFKSTAITFKFSINGKDNEMKSGVDHHFVCKVKDGMSETPLITFGQQLNDSKPSDQYLPADTRLKIRLDMRNVLKAFATQGYYTTFNGDKIYKDDFKGVYVAGSTAPLTWDFDNLMYRPNLQLHDEDSDGIYELTLRMNSPEDETTTASQWKASKDLQAFPRYTSAYPISNALYNLALEEMINAVEPDSTFRTGKEWAGVWTRDISYSIVLSMAHLQPQVAKYSLLRKVNKKKKIIQDTGTGGAWPASTDRMIWAVAAWELYKVTGDKDWLQEAYTIIKNSIDTDFNTIYDPVTGLVKGESSFLDWREQTYPRWMQPVDIAQSECLGTNAVHYQANKVLSKMAVALHHSAEATKYELVAKRIKKGVNTYLWQPGKGYYGQFLYGHNALILSPRAEALGEALAVIFDIAGPSQQKQIVSRAPCTDFGISCIYPQIPNIPPYHNNAVWPFVQTYWLWASAKAGNERAVMESIAAIYRPAALFVTNKENFVADNGDFLGTQINSSNMLWSLSGSISIVHKVLFGIRFNESSLHFEPFVPKSLEGRRTLSNFRYRDALLDIDMAGYGNSIKRFEIDGKVMKVAEVPAILKGRHHILIQLSNNTPDQQVIHKVANYTSLPSPEASYENGRLQWTPVNGAAQYIVLKNGKKVRAIRETCMIVSKGRYAEYQVIAVDENSVPSFASEPLAVCASRYIQTYEVEVLAGKAGYDYKGFSGTGFTEISLEKNRVLNLPVTVPEDGVFAIDFRYANGNGPTNTENKCAIRTLNVDHKPAGTTLFPQRGKELWSDWGFSNVVKVPLKKGQHTITLLYEDTNENMNEAVNAAMIDQLRLIKTANL